MLCVLKVVLKIKLISKMIEEDVLKMFDRILKEVEEMKSEKKEMYTNKEMLELLDVSSATLKKWRNYGYIGYSQVGSTYYYSAKDLEDFLKHNHSSAYAYM